MVNGTKVSHHGKKKLLGGRLDSNKGETEEPGIGLWRQKREPDHRLTEVVEENEASAAALVALVTSVPQRRTGKSQSLEGHKSRI